MRLIVFIVVFIFAMPKIANASTTAIELQAYCQKGISILNKGVSEVNPENMLQAGTCFGISEGILFAFLVELEDRGCKTLSLPYMQGVQIFLEYMDKHPERQGKPAAGEMWLALIETIPCTKKPQ